MVDSLKGKSDNPTEVVESAANRLLGKITVSAVPGDPFEAKIFEIMKKALRSIPAFKYGVLPGSPSDQDDPRQPQSPGHQNGMQDSSFQQSFQHTGPELSNPAVARPAFTGQGRSRPSSTVTPSPGTVGSFQRSEPGVHANTPALMAGNTTTQIDLGGTVRETPPVAGVTTNHTSLGNTVPGTFTAGSDLAPLHSAPPISIVNQNIEGAATPLPSVPANGQLAGQKRSHSDTDDAQERESKRVSTGNQLAPQKVDTIALMDIPEVKEMGNPSVTPSPPGTTA